MLRLTLLLKGVEFQYEQGQQNLKHPSQLYHKAEDLKSFATLKGKISKFCYQTG